MNRAFHVGGLVWMAAIFAAVQLQLDPVLWALAGGILLAVLIFRGKLPLWAYAAAAAFCCSMASLAVYNAVALAPAAQYLDTIQPINGLVVEREDHTTWTRLVLRMAQNDARAGLRGVRVRLDSPTRLDVSVGDVVHYTGKLTCPEERRTALYSSDTLFQSELIGSVEKTATYPDSFPAVLERWREGVRGNLTRQLPREEGAVLSAMLVGRDEQISPELRYDYSRSGIAHMLAISGLHLAVLAGMADALLRGLPVSRRQRTVVSMLLILAFMALSGFPYSVIRAGVMALLCRAAALFGRDSDGLNSLGFSLIFILLWNPYAVYSVGLQLTYFATMGIAAFANPLTGWFSRCLFGKSQYRLAQESPWQCSLLAALAATLCANLLTAPFLCWYFGQLSLVSPLVNLLAGFPAAVAMGCGLLCGFTGFFLPSVSRILGLLAGLAVRFLNKAAVFFARPPWAAISVQDDGVIFWLGAAVALCAVLVCSGATARLKRYTASLMAMSLLVLCLAHHGAWGSVLEVAAVRNGDALTVVYGTQAVVIGAPKNIQAARNTALFLRDRGVKTIALLVAEEEAEFLGDPATLLMEAVPVETQVSLDQTRSFMAEVFGQVVITVQGKNATYVTLDLGGTRMIKEFSPQFVRADLLVNRRNELIFAPGREFAGNDRYFNSTILTLRALPAEGRSPNENSDRK